MYKYEKVPTTTTGSDPAVGEGTPTTHYKRTLFDAIAFDTGRGMSSPLGPDETFEVFIEELT